MWASEEWLRNGLVYVYTSIEADAAEPGWEAVANQWIAENKEAAAGTPARGRGGAGGRCLLIVLILLFSLIALLLVQLTPLARAEAGTIWYIPQQADDDEAVSVAASKPGF